MLNFIFLTTLAVTVNAFALPSFEESKIYGGKLVKIEDYPHQVAITHGNDLWCGGSILSQHSVLTADHCVSMAFYPLVINAGTSVWNKPGSIHTVKANITFKQHLFTTDVAILVVNEPFTFDATRQPIPLFVSGETLKSGTLATVTGWGDTENRDISEQLLAVQIPIVDHDTCNKAYERANSSLAPIVASQICAGSLGRDSCQGDSGGPLIFNRRQVGIVSTGEGCGLADLVGLYTSVSYFSQWISTHIVP